MSIARRHKTIADYSVSSIPAIWLVKFQDMLMPEFMRVIRLASEELPAQSRCTTDVGDWLDLARGRAASPVNRGTPSTCMN